MTTHRGECLLCKEGFGAGEVPWDFGGSEVSWPTLHQRCMAWLLWGALLAKLKLS